MHFAENAVESSNFIRGYQNGFIQTLTAEFNTSIVLFDNQALTLLPQEVQDLKLEHFEALAAELKPEIILLGTGATQHQIHPSISQPLFKHRIGFEVMTTDAACRTFNLLLSEDRAVMAALFA